jgi:16S rRNA (guanine966-N2)-methyltransferase
MTKAFGMVPSVRGGVAGAGLLGDAGGPPAEQLSLRSVFREQDCAVFGALLLKVRRATDRRQPTVRVISGTARGTVLRAPSTGETRPISDRAKESLFNILGRRVEESSFLDLFAGTGGVGIEALSRGAARATFVERSAPIVADVRHNLARTHLADRATVRHMDAFRYLQGTPAPFDIVFVAPPQWHRLWQRALLALDGTPEWVAEGGLVVVQHDPKEYERLDLLTVAETDNRRYGRVNLVFYARRT